MNFSNIKSIEIPLGVVKQITTSLGVVLWLAGPTDYSKRYLTLVARDSGTFNFAGKSDGTNTNTIQYSTDNGQTWSTAAQSVTVNVSNDDKVLWKGEMALFSFGGIGNFTNSTASFDIEGNIMSLLYGDNFKGQINLTEKNYAFMNVFLNTKCVNSNNLILPATILSQLCYQTMFDGCTSLTTPPELPATTLAQWCYSNMFNGCTSLTIAPELSATTLVKGCYTNMFYGCSSLTTAPELSATTLADECYDGMFLNCISLTTAPELSVTTLASGCYRNMFCHCTSLTTPPELPAITLANSCYGNMFNGCTSLTTAPELPATTLASRCYEGMLSETNFLPDCSNIDFTNVSNATIGAFIGLFKGTKVTDNDLRNILPINPSTNHYYLPATTLSSLCYLNMFAACTSLTTPPELPATTLAQWCYSNMFNGCTSLTSAPNLPATLPYSFCYNLMFEGCTALTSGPIISLESLSQQSCNKMFYNCSSLNYITAYFHSTTNTGTLNNYTKEWVSHVAATGIFVYSINSSGVYNLPTGPNGVPTGWTVIYYDTTEDKYYLDQQKSQECDDHGNAI